MFTQNNLSENYINLIILNILIVIVVLCLMNYYSTKLLIKVIRSEIINIQEIKSLL